MDKLDRPEVIHGRTYRVRSPNYEHTFFVTINSMEVEGTVRPFELFISTKEVEQFEWVTTVTRLLSGALRQPGPFPRYVLEELEQSYDPAGGYFIPGTDGVKVNGIVSHIGYILRQHCEELGVL